MSTKKKNKTDSIIIIEKILQQKIKEGTLLSAYKVFFTLLLLGSNKKINNEIFNVKIEDLDSLWGKDMSLQDDKYSIPSSRTGKMAFSQIVRYLKKEEKRFIQVSTRDRDVMTREDYIAEIRKFISNLIYEYSGFIRDFNIYRKSMYIKHFEEEDIFWWKSKYMNSPRNIFRNFIKTQSGQDIFPEVKDEDILFFRELIGKAKKKAQSLEEKSYQCKKCKSNILIQGMSEEERLGVYEKRDGTCDVCQEEERLEAIRIRRKRKEEKLKKEIRRNEKIFEEKKARQKEEELRMNSSVKITKLEPKYKEDEIKIDPFEIEARKQIRKFIRSKEGKEIGLDASMEEEVFFQVIQYRFEDGCRTIQKCLEMIFYEENMKIFA